MRRNTVIFDFGGVITTSPFEAFARLEREYGLPDGFIRTINRREPDANAWARFERAEIDAEVFDTLFAIEAEMLGHRLQGRDVLAVLLGEIRPRMVAALDWLKVHGYRIGCITNNLPTGEGPGMARSAGKAEAVAAIMARFDHVVESSKAGIRKPDPAIYRLACDTLGAVPQQCVYLDDLGINCKPAAAMGMAAIKVASEDQALHNLADALELPLDSF